MKAELVKKIRSTAEKLNLNMEILFDNMEILNTKLAGTVVAFDDANEVVTYLRNNDSPTQMFIAPFELGFKDYECIQRISIQGSNPKVREAIDTLSNYCGGKADAMKELLSTSTANQTYHATPSTQNVTDREGTAPQMYDTNNMNAGGESRVKSQPAKRVTIKLNEDGSIPDGVSIPQPKF